MTFICPKPLSMKTDFSFKGDWLFSETERAKLEYRHGNHDSCQFEFFFVNTLVIETQMQRTDGKTAKSSNWEPYVLFLKSIELSAYLGLRNTSPQLCLCPQ